MIYPKSPNSERAEKTPPSILPQGRKSQPIVLQRLTKRDAINCVSTNNSINLDSDN